MNPEVILNFFWILVIVIYLSIAAFFIIRKCKNDYYNYSDYSDYITMSLMPYDHYGNCCNCVESFIANNKTNYSEYFSDNFSDYESESNTYTNENSEQKNVHGNKKMRVIGGEGIKYDIIDFPDYKKTIEIFDKLNRDYKKLITHLKKNHPNNEYTLALIKNYKFYIAEVSPRNLNNLTSYMEDKVELNMCVRTKKSPHNFHDYNLLMFVFLHELGHAANIRSYGHDGLFVKAFKFLLKNADQIGIIKRIDFEKDPQNFCGLAITNNIQY